MVEEGSNGRRSTALRPLGQWRWASGSYYGVMAGGPEFYSGVPGPGRAGRAAWQVWAPAWAYGGMGTQTAGTAAQEAPKAPATMDRGMVLQGKKGIYELSFGGASEERE